jgi:hypothetical protein
LHSDNGTGLSCRLFTGGCVQEWGCFLNGTGYRAQNNPSYAGDVFVAAGDLASVARRFRSARSV